MPRRPLKLSHALLHGRGFVIVKMPQVGYSPEESQLVYWLLGRPRGSPWSKTLRAQCSTTSAITARTSAVARFSVTNAESTFHTDNSFGDGLDIVGLLCLHPAKAGGLSQLVNGWSLHNLLLQEHPEALPLLYQRYHIDRRGGTRPGEAPTILVPIITWDGQGLTFRYLRCTGSKRASRRSSNR